RVNIQILHAANTGGRTATGLSTAAALAPARKAQIVRSAGNGNGTRLAQKPKKSAHPRPLSNESFTLNWDDLALFPQPNDVTCWATSGAMVIGWRDQACITAEYVADIAGRTTTQGLSPDDRRKFASEIGLACEEPQSYTIDAFRSLLENFGPLWVGVVNPS